MHHQRVGQQRTQHLELVLPVPGQMLQQRVGLRFAQRQILQELQQQTDFVEGQADDINEVGDLDDDLHAEFTAAEHAGNLAIVVLGAAIDLVSDQDGPALFQTPHRPACATA